jgi:hypothetical protein
MEKIPFDKACPVSLAQDLYMLTENDIEYSDALSDVMGQVDTDGVDVEDIDFLKMNIGEEYDRLCHLNQYKYGWR